MVVAEVLLALSKVQTPYWYYNLRSEVLPTGTTISVVKYSLLVPSPVLRSPRSPTPYHPRYPSSFPNTTPDPVLCTNNAFLLPHSSPPFPFQSSFSLSLVSSSFLPFPFSSIFFHASDQGSFAFFSFFFFFFSPRFYRGCAARAGAQSRRLGAQRSQCSCPRTFRTRY